MVRNWLLLLSGCILMGSAMLTHAAISVRLERPQITLDETVRLIVETDQLDSNEEPDLTTISEQFTIVGRSASQNVSIVNGQQSATRKWTLELQPKNIGSFSIGPVILGTEQSQLLRIAVLPAPKDAAQGADIFLESMLDIEQPYVQQQVTLTVRLFLAKRLLDGSLTDPTPENTLVERLGEDLRYETNRGNRQYSVYERKYALFPQQSGQLTIPAVGFQGLMDDKGTGSQMEFSGFFQQGKRVQAQTTPLQLQVRPPDFSFSGNQWLPAHNLLIEDIANANLDYTVGQPITRKIQLLAQGLAAEQLPTIGFPETPGIRYYPDQPTTENRNDGKHILGLQLNSVAVIPTQPGPMEIPGIEIPWWNVKSEKMEIASLPAISVNVLDNSASGNKNSENQNLLNDSSVESNQTDSSFAPVPIQTSDQSSKKWWKRIAIASIVLWLASLSIIGWLFNKFKRQLRSQQDDEGGCVLPSEAKIRKKLKTACHNNNPLFARKYLTQWANVHYGKPLSLSQLSGIFNDPTLSIQLDQLDQFLYSAKPGMSDWSGMELWQSISRLIHASRQKKPSNKPGLTALYP